MIVGIVMIMVMVIFKNGAVSSVVERFLSVVRFLHSAQKFYFLVLFIELKVLYLHMFNN